MFKRAGVDTENFHTYICKGLSIVIERHGGLVTTSARYLGDPRGKLPSVLSW